MASPVWRSYVWTVSSRDEHLEPDPVIEVYKKDIDRTLLRENLKLSPDERLLKLIDFVRFTEELRRDRQGARELG